MKRKLFRSLTVLAAVAVSLTMVPNAPAQADTNSSNGNSLTIIKRETLSEIDQAHKLPGVGDAAKLAKQDASLAKSVTWDVPDLNSTAIERYNQYITLESDGTFRSNIPAEFYFTDPKGAWAATNAVTAANTTVVQQLELLQAKGYQVKLNEYVYGQPLPMGEHASFTPLWWGMTFTFDAVATKQIDIALTVGDGALSVVQALSGIGVIMAPPVGAIVGAVALVLKMSIAMTKKCMTNQGLVIKSLWLPIPWCEKPTKQFVPALKYGTFTHKSTGTHSTSTSGIRTTSQGQIAQPQGKQVIVREKPTLIGAGATSVAYLPSVRVADRQSLASTGT